MKRMLIIMMALATPTMAQPSEPIPADVHAFLDACDARRELLVEQLTEAILRVSRRASAASRGSVEKGKTGPDAEERIDESGLSVWTFRTVEAKRETERLLRAEVRDLAESRQVLMSGRGLTVPMINQWTRNELQAGMIGRLTAPETGMHSADHHFDVFQVIDDDEMVVQVGWTEWRTPAPAGDQGDPTAPGQARAPVERDGELYKFVGIDTSQFADGQLRIELGQSEIGQYYKSGMSIYRVSGVETYTTASGEINTIWVFHRITVEPWASLVMEGNDGSH